MVKKVGLLYDSVNNNTGDAAIGLSVQKMLREIGVNFEVLLPGRFKADNYGPIVVGGGHILRPGPDFFYDRFRLPGSHILNAAGIVGTPPDLGYLDDYEYVSVRSHGDRDKLSYLNKKVHVVPCTTMLLEDLKDFHVPIIKPSLGVHLLPGMLRIHEEKAFIRWASSLPYTIYFIPITHYNDDDRYMKMLSSRIRNSVLLPRLRPLEIFTLAGKLDYIISCSLHGGIFAYAHNTPFILWDYNDKMRFFMEERGLGQYLYKDYAGMKEAFGRLCRESPDYSTPFSHDLSLLHGHVDRLKELLPIGMASPSSKNRSYESSSTTATMDLGLRINMKYVYFNRKVRYGVSRLKANTVEYFYR